MTPMQKRTNLVGLCSILFTCVVLSACDNANNDIDPGVIGDGTFQSIVEKYIENRNLPALTVIIAKDGNVLESASAGKRSFESSARITEDDHWQIGSVSKAVTASLAARLVELGFLTWETTIEDIFPEHLDQIHPDNHSITLTELLQHRSGLAREVEVSEFEISNLDRFGYSIRGLGETPNANRSSFRYSNLGYTVAGLMLGQATGLSWENSLQQFLFTPLEITNYGFGFPDPGDNLAQPIGHIRRTDHSGERVNDYWIPVYPANSRVLDFLLINAPAGAIYLSKQDYVKFQNLHLSGAADESEFLTEESFIYLHRPPDGEEYAMGWYVMDEESLADFNLPNSERVLNHSGGTGITSARSVIIPDRKLSIFIAFNSNVDSGRELLKLIFARLEITE